MPVPGLLVSPAYVLMSSNQHHIFLAARQRGSVGHLVYKSPLTLDTPHLTHSKQVLEKTPQRQVALLAQPRAAGLQWL
jgi:hypothetical protein